MKTMQELSQYQELSQESKLELITQVIEAEREAQSYKQVAYLTSFILLGMVVVEIARVVALS